MSKECNQHYDIIFMDQTRRPNSITEIYFNVDSDRAAMGSPVRKSRLTSSIYFGHHTSLLVEQ